MAGYSETPLAKKLGIKAGDTVLTIHKGDVVRRACQPPWYATERPRLMSQIEIPKAGRSHELAASLPNIIPPNLGSLGYEAIAVCWVQMQQENRRICGVSVPSCRQRPRLAGRSAASWPQRFQRRESSRRIAVKSFCRKVYGQFGGMKNKMGRRKMNSKKSGTNIAQHLHMLKFALIAGSLLGCCIVMSGGALSATAPIQLAPQQLSRTIMQGVPARLQASWANMPPNYHQFGAASVDRPARPEALTLKFSASTTVTRISSTPDLKVLPGGTCDVGHHYRPGNSCRLLVQFTPQGPGPRLGRVVLDTSTNRPVAIHALGYYYVPAVSFTPSTIINVPATVSGGVGQILSAQNLAIDNGDELYIADTGNNLIRYIDSSGTMKTIASGFSAPWGVTVDSFGQVYFDRPSSNALHEIYDYGPVVTLSGSTTGACPASAPCNLAGHAITKPGEMSIDPYDNMFFTEQSSGGAFSKVQPAPANLIFLYDPFPYQTVVQGPAAMDSYDNIYSLWATSAGSCEIVQQTLYNAENNNQAFVRIAGGRTCGFSGDGGRAGSAEIGNQVGQIAFDLAGNLYFTDSENYRIRRIDYNTGIIRTIAGNGGNGYTGNGGSALDAALGAPTGLAVDSQGQVYVLAQTKAPPQQVVRKITATGILNFGTVTHGKTSAAKILNVSNTGNSALVITRQRFVGPNKTDFKIDLDTTTCNLAAGSVLNIGQSCQIGVLFTPGAVGNRAASLKLLDNTVSGANLALLRGTGG